MTVRLVIAVVLTLLLAFLTVQVGSFLHETDDSKIALIAETESYAARSRLVRQIDALLAGLREVHDYWEAHAALPLEEWPDYRGTVLDQLSGLELLLWIDGENGRQFLHTAERPVLNAAPDQSQAASIAALLRDATGVRGEAMLGPFAGEGGQRIRVVINRTQGVGMLIAELHAPSLFGALLRDQSPDYALKVRWRGETLFQRGIAAVDVPEDWRREGMISTSLGSVLEVVHSPTADLTESLSTPALAAVLPLGFVISALVGLLVYENGRVNVRADAARQARQQIAELNKGLEGQVAERTEELAGRNADLITISESVTHDLRSPLNAISVNVALIEQRLGQQFEKEDGEAFERITSGVRRMAEILERVVGLSLAAHSTFEPEPLSMRALITEVFEQLSSFDPPPPAVLELDEFPDIEADDTLVRILVLNLLSNALRHTRGKEPRRVSVSGTQGANAEVIFCFRDNGSGLDADEAAHLFTSSERSAGNRRTGGTGLGLVIAERIVRRHGGRIWATGIKGEEAAIHFTLEPASDEAARVV